MKFFEYLKKRFNKDKIYLVGHSWGSMLGMLTVKKYPDSFYAYIGTGQEADMIEGELLSYQYIIKQAKELTLLNMKKQKSLIA